MVSMILLAEAVKQVTKIGLLMLHVRFFLKSIFIFIILHEIFGTVTVVASGFHLLNMFGHGILKISRVGVCSCDFTNSNVIAHSRRVVETGMCA